MAAGLPALSSSIRKPLPLHPQNRQTTSPTNLTFDHCIIQRTDGAAVSFGDGVEVKNVESFIADGKAAAELASPKSGWRGGDKSFDAKSRPTLGFRWPAKE